MSNLIFSNDGCDVYLDKNKIKFTFVTDKYDKNHNYYMLSCALRFINKKYGKLKLEEVKPEPDSFLKYKIEKVTMTNGMFNDNVNNPKHYTTHPSGIECIEITKHMNFCIGNAVKYLWRAGLKDDRKLDLKKAKKYIDFELERLKRIDTD